MSHIIAVGLAAMMLAGWNVQSKVEGEQGKDANVPTAVRSTPRETNKAKFGPPPPGYVRIVGEPVPNWNAADMHRQDREPGMWYSLGPKPIVWEYWSGNDDASGRVVSIAIDPTDSQTVYIASASGGIWKTVDGGNLWVPLTDELSILNHGAIALDPTDPDIVYAGTGEYTTLSTGDGLFRSTDGGLFWDRIATTSDVGATCSGIAVDPNETEVIHVTGDLGYCRTLDNGDNWYTMLSGARCSSLALNKTHPMTLYVGRHYDGVYRSTDGGDTWTRLSNGLPSSNVSRVLVAVADSNPDVVYASILGTDGHLEGLYRSADGGDSWTAKPNTPDYPYPQGSYDMFMQVDPTNANTVYCGGVFPSYAEAGVIKSTDGGNSWTDISVGSDSSQLHPDQHAIAFAPDGTVWVGNDGGVWKSTNAGNTWINCNATLNVTQNYEIALHPSNPARLMGGTQDNGTIAREADVDEWPQFMGGDGGFLAFDHADPTRVYTTYVYLTVYRTDGFGTADISGAWGSDSRNFIAPLVMDPSDSHTLLAGTDRVWRSTDAHSGANWTPISNTTVSSGTTLNAIAISHQDSDKIYVGNRAGDVYVTSNAATWNARTTGLPISRGEVADIVVDPNNDDVAYVSFHHTTGMRVLRTDNSGVLWSNVTGDLPGGASARALAVDWAFDPPHLYVGSGAGIYWSSDGGSHWEKDGTDLPNVNIGDLRIDPVQRTITAGTYGRGSWRAALADGGVFADIDGDGDVDLSDLQLLLATYGKSAGDAGYNGDADLDNDGTITLADLQLLLSNYGYGA